MPGKNIVKEFAEDNYYHIYNRGVEKRVIFQDEQDYRVFLGLLKKYLTGENNNPNNRHRIQKLGDEVQLIAYCLMPNHFHLLLYQKDKLGITKLMRRVSTGYAMYFNDRYNRVGSLFQGNYKASLINKDDYLQHISRYIHLNPKNYKEWPYSSLSHYIGNKSLPWVTTKQILELFDNNKQAYLEFVEDYEASKNELDVLKWQLANDLEE